MNPRLIRVLRWLVPCIAVGIATFVVCSAQLRLDAAKVKKEDAKKALVAAEEARDTIIKMGTRNRFATEPASQTEEAKFLAGLKRHAAAPGASIVKWSSSAETYLPQIEGEEPTSEKPGADPALVGITRVTSDLVLGGSYSSLRTFLHNISKSNRLYTVKDVRWNREKNGSLLTMRLSRYVEPPKEEQDAMMVATAASPMTGGTP